MNQPPIRRVKNPYELTVNFKSALFILALLIVLSVLAYTQFIVERLRDDSRVREIWEYRWFVPESGR